MNAHEFDLEATLAAIAKLKPKERELLVLVSSFVKGDGKLQHYAQQEGVQDSAISARMVKIYKQLGLSDAPGRKNFIKQALSEFEQRKKPSVPAASTPEMVNGHVHEGVVQPVLLSAVHAVEEAPAPAPIGIGVTIPLPQDVTDVDVVSTRFSGTVAPHTLKEAIRLRKREGFKPGVLVLTTTTDPTVSHAQLVFFQHKGD